MDRKPRTGDCSAGLAGCVCFNFRKAARVITKLYDDALRPSGLTATQFSILSVLGFVGPASIVRLAGHLAMERTTLTRNLRLLEKSGLVRARPGADQRRRIVSVSARGRKAFEGALPLWSEAQSRVTAKIGPSRWGGMLGDLHEIVEAFRAG